MELMSSVHDFTTDTFMCALYDPTATLDENTTVYSNIGEVVGAGYVAGGKPVTGINFQLSGNLSVKVACDHLSWPASTIVMGGLLIYNASKGNAAVCVLKFDASSSGSELKIPLDFILVLTMSSSGTNVEICKSFVTELLSGIHDLRTVGDDLYIALYDDSTVVDENITSYTPVGELDGSVPSLYTTGGAQLIGFGGVRSQKLVFDGSAVEFYINENVGDFGWWPCPWNATSDQLITARYALIYNSTKMNRAVLVIDFCDNISFVNTVFPMISLWPSNGLIRIQ